MCMCLLGTCLICRGQSSFYEKNADSLFESSAYFLAAVLYHRTIFNNDSKNVNLLKYKRGESLKFAGDYAKALEVFENIGVSTQDTLFGYVFYQRVLSAYLDGNYNKAEFFIEQEQFMTEDTFDNDIVPLHILVLAENEKFEDAFTLLEQYLEKSGKTGLVSIDSLRQLANKYKNPEKATALSTFIPGSGQIYDGYPGNGILSFLLQVTSLAFVGYNVLNEYYLIGIFTGGGLFQKFYFGGIQNASNLAVKRNYQIRRVIVKKLKNILYKKIGGQIN